MSRSFEFRERPRHDDGKTEIDVICNGRPWGLIWTWPSTREDWHPWHVKPIAGDYHAYLTLDAAKAAARCN